MKKLLLLLGLIFCAASAHASCTTPITAGMSTSQVQTALNSCSSGSTASFPAGTYVLGASKISIPCGVSITGPTVSPNYTSWGTLTYSNQTAILTSSSRSSMFFSVTGCTTACLLYTSDAADE